MLRHMGLVISSAQLETILYVTNTWTYIFGITTSLRFPSPFCKLLFVALKLLLSNVISTPPWLVESNGLETWQTLKEEVIHLTITVHSIFKMVSALTLVSPRSWKCDAFLVAIVVVNQFPRFLFKMPGDNCTVAFFYLVQEIQSNRHLELTPHCLRNICWRLALMHVFSL